MHCSWQAQKDTQDFPLQRNWWDTAGGISWYADQGLVGGIAGGLLIEVIMIFCSTTERSNAEPVRLNQDCKGEKGI